MLAALIISKIIPEGSAALPAFIVLTTLETMSVVILNTGPLPGGLSLKFEAFHGYSAFNSFDNATAKLYQKLLKMYIFMKDNRDRCNHRTTINLL